MLLRSTLLEPLLKPRRCPRAVLPGRPTSAVLGPEAEPEDPATTTQLYHLVDVHLELLLRASSPAAAMPSPDPVLATTSLSTPMSSCSTKAAPKPSTSTRTDITMAESRSCIAY